MNYRARMRALREDRDLKQKDVAKVINILSGQYILLVLKAGYMTNTTYGYIKWTKYIKEHPEVMEEKSFF